MFVINNIDQILKINDKKIIKAASYLHFYIIDFNNSFKIVIVKETRFRRNGLGPEDIQKEENSNEILKLPKSEAIDEKNKDFLDLSKKKDINEVNPLYYNNLLLNEILENNKEILDNYNHSTNSDS